jgi:hypothetical protein
MTDLPLRLLAQDPDDLVLISAALQDATVKLADISYAPAARTLTFPLTRFRWEREEPSRAQAAVQFGDVLEVKARGLPRDRDSVCSLLAIEFTPSDTPPGGELMLHFAGCGDLKVLVDCVDAALVDLGAPEPAEGLPQHPEALG